MDEKIKALLNQVRILEEEANKHSAGNERAELFRAAGRIKNQVATLLNQCGKSEPGSKVPDPNAYFSAQLPEGFENYFHGDYLTPEMESYFNNLTPEMESYFSVPKIQNFDNAPSAKPEPAKTQEFDDWELRRRILNAIGIPC
ncbi:hypothetical protein [Escherichia coli]|uniref:hypothetical protein n=1 Tax=Escherichia coli TaxID=562 RepID=UPI0018A0681A|nr:hypothetical protein [Escherichia coli]QPE55688.1 hypothetical protein IMP96_00025 [Escherichia coli]QPE97010.1 hypothetical protein IMP23_00035 [Escherichia coli]